MRRVKWIVVGAVLSLTACRQAPPQTLEVFSRTQVAMGDVAVTIRIAALPSRADAAYAAMSEVFALARQIEAAVSEFQPTSATSRLNRAPAGSWVQIGPHLNHLLQRSREMSMLTDGHFDITYQTPAVSYRDIELSTDGTKARWKRSAGRIGLSGIAKGYIVDRMAERLMALHWHDFLINAGGDIRSQGLSPQGPWLITLLDPAESHFEKHCLLTLANQSIATSGDYARGAHIIDPRNGRPVEADWIAISVIATDTETADALATAAYASGQTAYDSLLHWHRRDKHLSGILVDRDGNLTTVGLTASATEITCQPLNIDSKKTRAMGMKR